MSERLKVLAELFAFQLFDQLTDVVRYADGLL